MAWINILTIPGLTYTLTYSENSTPITPSAALSVGSDFTIAASDYDLVELHITSFGSAVTPAAMRVVLSNVVFGVDDSTNPYGAGGAIYSSSAFSPPSPTGSMPYSGTVTDTTANTYIRVGAGYIGAFYVATSGSFVVEVDTIIPTPSFWQDFEGTYEDVELHKPPALVYVPAVNSQPAVPETTYCLPEYPDAPGPGCVGQLDADGNCVPNVGGSGSGSSPPPPDTPPPGEPAMCWPSGDGLQCCRYDGVGVFCS